MSSGHSKANESQKRTVDVHLGVAQQPAAHIHISMDEVRERMAQMGPRCRSRRGSARCELPKGHTGRHNSEWGDW